MTFAFPQVYVISLARAKERRENMRRRLDALGMPYEIVDAVDGATLNLEDYAHRLRQNECRVKHGYELTRGEIGCYLSHHNLWKRIAEGENEHALILEDDAVWDDDFAEVVGELLRCEWHWEAVLLSADKPRPIDAVLCSLPGGRKLVRYKRRAWTAAAYLLSRSGAAKLRDYGEKINAVVDCVYFEYWKNGVAFYCVHPPAAGQSGEETTLAGREQVRAKAKRTMAERMFGSVLRKADRLSQAYFLITNPPRKQ